MKRHYKRHWLVRGNRRVEERVGEAVSQEMRMMNSHQSPRGEVSALGLAVDPLVDMVVELQAEEEVGHNRLHPSEAQKKRTTLVTRILTSRPS
jgi:hypothetical protein